MVGSLGSPEANIMDSDIVVSEFELQLRYCIHFWTNALLKGMNPLSYGIKGSTAFPLQGFICH